MKLREVSPEVLVADEPIVALSREEISDLKTRAMNSPRRRARICAHKANSDAVHEMLIAAGKGCYIRPHKHLAKSESFHVLEGELEVVIFDEAGQVTKTIALGGYDSGAGFFYRCDIPEFHTVLVRSEVAVFHETTRGPFNPDDNVLAPWSPDERDKEGVIAYLGNFDRSGEAS